MCTAYFMQCTRRGTCQQKNLVKRPNCWVSCALFSSATQIGIGTRNAPLGGSKRIAPLGAKRGDSPTIIGRKKGLLLGLSLTERLDYARAKPDLAKSLKSAKETIALRHKLILGKVAAHGLRARPAKPTKHLAHLALRVGNGHQMRPTLMRGQDARRTVTPRRRGRSPWRARTEPPSPTCLRSSQLAKSHRTSRIAGRKQVALAKALQIGTLCSPTAKTTIKPKGAFPSNCEQPLGNAPSNPVIGELTELQTPTQS